MCWKVNFICLKDATVLEHDDFACTAISAACKWVDWYS